MSTTTTAVKEYPISFSGPMILAILKGVKTQTRRICKHDPAVATFPSHKLRGPSEWSDKERDYFVGTYSPYGLPGCRLWVKESLQGTIDTKIHDDETMPVVKYAADGTHIWTKDKYREPWPWKRATLSSRYMPRRLCRIELELTELRVERLQDITNEDAQAEGIQVDECNHAIRENDDINWGSARGAYAELWERINGKSSWKLNPWVWVVSFRKVSA